jgi:nucleotide sugar dehydrogenase
MDSQLDSQLNIGTIGIIGIGVVGSAIKHVLEKFQIPLKLYDKYKNLGKCVDELLDCTMIFICLPTPFKPSIINEKDEKDENCNNNTGQYDKTELYNVIDQLATLKYAGIIIIKSTVEPGTTKTLQTQHGNLTLVHNPEFLCAKTATEDFLNQTHIIIGASSESLDISLVVNFYKKYFPDVKMSLTTSDTSEMVKITCNSFYACKIQFFTEIKLFCDKFGIPYNTVRDLIIKNGWINPMHLEVPGHDGLMSFGGACLPKDIQSLNSLLEAHHIDNEVINAVVNENKKMRP